MFFNFFSGKKIRKNTCFLIFFPAKKHVKIRIKFSFKRLYFAQKQLFYRINTPKIQVKSNTVLMHTMAKENDDFTVLKEYLKKYKPKKTSEENGVSLLNRLEALKKQDKKFSEVQDQEGNYYVDLVQEGGGTLGIALVGFVFVLEYCNIRFMNLAGTSAGAINTILLHHFDSPEKPKSPKLFDLLKNKMDLKSFIDGNGFSRFLINNILNKTGVVDALGVLFLVKLLLLLTTLPVLAYLYNNVGWHFLAILILFLLYVTGIVFYLSSFKKNQFGLNKGDAFLSFMKENISRDAINKSYNITTLRKNITEDADAIVNRFEQSIKKHNEFGLTKKMIDKAIEGNKRLLKEATEFKASYTVITSENVSQNKVEFPRDADLFWSNKGIDTPHPAEFARASMSIPVFFKPFEKEIAYNDAEIQQAWLMKLNTTSDAIPAKAWFTDGGTLSNFPINIFHDPSVIIARIPVIGARLQDDAPKKEIRKVKTRTHKSDMPFSGLIDYLLAIFNTVRFNYDKSFLRKHTFYQTYCVAEIEVYKSKISWLNFSLSDDEKMELIVLGMKAGLKHLENFDWEKYQIARAAMVIHND